MQIALTNYEARRKPMVLAAVIAQTIGLRASEILKRKFRDLHADCGILWIDRGKRSAHMASEAGTPHSRWNQELYRRQLHQVLGTAALQ